MARWTIDQSTTRSLDGIVALRIRIVGGLVNILPTDDPMTFEISDIVGEPLLVTHEAGILTVTYEDLTRGGLLDRLRPAQLAGYRGVGRRGATVSVRVPRDCPLEVTTVSAPVVIAGLTGRTQVRSASGDVTLDDLGGTVEISTVSGNLAARGLSGSLRFNSVSGQLAVAGGRLADVAAKTASGQLLADVDLAPAARVRLASISGDVALRVPSDTSAAVELRSATGALDSAFGLDRRDLRGRSNLTGKIGSGVDPASITTTTVSGAVSLLRREPDAPAAIPRGDA
ncbi:DUF4097 family beta strand repeat-containing protein [Marinitenerispora sediminis]|uniref:DUF4097 domain-containing protein n=1 Tax=Marinitenerispora sediminis TaxID=1931232 RepID=A0A368T7S9_9ACTN|nr:DUF4097 family beta strand repeat-containing protein [Marinitenerispora sediminis]RCV51122.1 hypothetical protein DEF28_16215 [Marinitenerispora sediminis]RCV58337.1 hypothetical protein DEF23_09110 [Marinitenerispora sediminis]RCV60141.1 hypothetical protein DEF24_07870 [Marinitenerispora sediminis]